METKDVAPLAATAAAGAAAAVPAPASQPPPASMAPPQHQQLPSPFAQQAAPAPGAPMPGGMRLSFDQMVGKAPGEQHHHARPMLYAPPLPPPQGAAAAGSPGGNVLGMGELMRKKRGRPRKYAPDGSMALALAPISSASAGGAAPPGQQQHGFSISSPLSDPNAKRRGRPPGSGKKKQFEALGSWGIAFTPHVLSVKAGEDVASKIMTFSQQGPRTVCILSANGAISNVTLRQPATSGGLVTYEGRFEIISLSGSFLLAEDGDTRSRTGGLSVALAGSDGRVLGGCVAGMLMAATPVQVVVASFIAEGKKSKPAEARKVEPMSAPPQMATFVPAPVATSPPSEGTSSASSDDSGSPINHSTMPYNHSGQHQHPHPNQQQHMPPAYASGGWSLSAHQQNRHDSDMKMMLN
ncbi:AT-hook motif nuclear-localized protein 10-like [Phragmites australis]|uniref:AT-hook motif nuclear-localized protein 10-like n=1 Tax=Phragmites australis TaxID=29695 RepID=UPI002D791701|nr:AT-hook motif nuclear-localized protein 10-like [Phragmites australis]XP_062200814.1 AT-hook motif nuclear-localized protein 10-like [Phragmites australis]